MRVLHRYNSHNHAPYEYYIEIFRSGKFGEFEEPLTDTMEDVWLKLQGDSFEKCIEIGIDEAGINMNDTNFGNISPSSAKVYVADRKNFT